MSYLGHNVGRRRVSERGRAGAVGGESGDHLGRVLDRTIVPSRRTGREGERSSDV